VLVLILRSAGARSCRQMRVRASRRMRTSVCPHASRRRAAWTGWHALRAFTRAARLLSMRAGEGDAVADGFVVPSEEPTCGCRKRCVTRAPCFRPVIYRELCNRGAWLGDARAEECRDSASGSRRLGRRCWKQPASVEARVIFVINRSLQADFATTTCEWSVSPPTNQSSCPALCRASTSCFLR
jgi:hypothetical protein